MTCKICNQDPCPVEHALQMPSLSNEVYYLQINDPEEYPSGVYVGDMIGLLKEVSWALSEKETNYDLKDRLDVLIEKMGG